MLFCEETTPNLMCRRRGSNPGGSDERSERYPLNQPDSYLLPLLNISTVIVLAISCTPSTHPNASHYTKRHHSNCVKVVTYIPGRNLIYPWY